MAPPEKRRRPRQQGKEDKDVTRCFCKQQVAEGTMIQCERCFVWQHVQCMELDENELPETYYCELCDPDAHAHLLKKSQNQTKDSKKPKARTTNNSLGYVDASDLPNLQGKATKRAKTSNMYDKDTGSSQGSELDGELLLGSGDEQQDDSSLEDEFLLETPKLNPDIPFSAIRIIPYNEDTTTITLEKQKSRPIFNAKSARYHKDMTVAQMLKRASGMLEFLKRSKQELDSMDYCSSEKQTEYAKMIAQFEADVALFQRQFPSYGPALKS